MACNRLALHYLYLVWTFLNKICVMHLNTHEGDSYFNTAKSKGIETLDKNRSPFYMSISISD